MQVAPSSATGTVELLDSAGTPGNATTYLIASSSVIGGTATFNNVQLGSNVHHVYAVYLGDFADYPSTSTQLTFDVFHS